MDDKVKRKASKLIEIENQVDDRLTDFELIKKDNGQQCKIDLNFEDYCMYHEILEGLGCKWNRTVGGVKRLQCQ